MSLLNGCGTHRIDRDCHMVMIDRCQISTYARDDPKHLSNVPGSEASVHALCSGQGVASLTVLAPFLDDDGRDGS